LAVFGAESWGLGKVSASVAHIISLSSPAYAIAEPTPTGEQSEILSPSHYRSFKFAEPRAESRAEPRVTEPEPSIE
jgi:hypothetical protein